MSRWGHPRRPGSTPAAPADPRSSTMLPVPPANTDAPTALEALIRAYRTFSRQIWDASSTHWCALASRCPARRRAGAAADTGWFTRSLGARSVSESSGANRLTDSRNNRVVG
jgi:hypothetical protein